MAKYQLTLVDVIIRTSDGASIPNDPANRDFVEYQAWLKNGNKPGPAPAIEEPKIRTKSERVADMFAREGLTLADLKSELSADLTAGAALKLGK